MGHAPPLADGAIPIAGQLSHRAAREGQYNKPSEERAVTESLLLRHYKRKRPGRR
jgi:hypothetical protein